ncbi:MAG TPA: hypothetical protein VL426_07045 [Candidatus Binatia bacterium]|nr:hypothetical protein [Candidatus Binatia bacterium]
MGIFYSKDPGRSGRKAMATFLLFLFGFFLASSTLLFGSPRQANAQYTDPITSVQTTTTNVWTTIKDAFVEAAVTAVVNGVNYFTSQLAYTAAVALTSDCPGQVVCWNSKAFEDGFKQAWQGAIGEAIGTLSTQGGFTKLGFDLCNPGIKFSLKIQLGALDEIKPPPPKCDFNAVASNWSNFKDSVTSGEVLKGLKPTFERGQAPLSVALGAQSGLYEVKEEAKRADVMKRIMDASAGGGFSDVRDPVSGRAKAPSSVTHDEFQRMKKMQQDNPQQYSASYAAGQIASKAVISIVVNAVQTFAMTLISRLLNKLINGLMSTEELIALQPDLILNPEGLLQPPGTTGATEALAPRFTAAQPKDTGIIDPLLEFSVCPGAERGPNNCVIDQQFANAVRVADVTPVTVREAVDKNMLHGDWPFVASSDPVKDQDPFCYTYAYCESNIKKLRAARILPIGWEIAARKAGPNTKLREVMAGFNNCNDQGTIDAAHPWCHLIDPDWVLKIPPTQCRAMAFGPVPLSSEIASRAEQCVDPQTCLKQDDNGNCTGGWGYCARERNVWRFNGDSCPAAYNTCRTLKARTGEIKNYVLNTIDHGVCNADNAGCRQYALNLSTVTCSLSSVCTHPVDASDPIKSCTCTVPPNSGTAFNTGSCTITKNNTSCTAPNGAVCRQPYPCNTASCSCTAGLTCEVEKGQRSCSSLTGAKAEGDDWQIDPSRFFNKNAQTCSATSNGCSSLVRLDAGDALNLVRNPSFEDVEDGDNDGTPDHATSWTPFGEVPSANKGFLSKDGSKAVDGANAMRLPVLATGFNPPGTLGTVAACTLPLVTNATINAGTCIADLGCPCTYGTAGNVLNDTCKVIKGQQKCSVTENVAQQGLPVRRKTTYTVSATFIPDSGNDVSGGIGLTFRDANGATVTLAQDDVVTTTGYSGEAEGTTPTVNCAATVDGTSGGAASGEINMRASGTKAATEKGLRASCTFVIDNKDVSHATLWLYTTSGTVYADAVQFEEGGGSSYHSAYGGANTSETASIKVPPDFLGCTGDEGDRPECNAFAGVCRENEVGCDAYTPTNGDATVPGIAGPQDRCPQECAGYDVFKQEESDFDTVKFPVYFIPTTATSCTENEVGCSEFTNLETEKVEYYSHLRLCIKPDDATKGVYYSWEGSDTTGYQLLVWNLKNTTDTTNTTAAPVVNGSPADITAGLANDICADAGCANAGPAPCTRLNAQATACASQAIGNGSSDTAGYCNRSAIDGGDFDCREFYDALGNRHYRQLSKTIIASSSCVQYRITTSTQADCEKSNGRWDSAKGQCVYFADAGASNVCPKEQNGCRAYKGNASTNVQSLLHDDFEDWPGNWKGSGDVTLGVLTQSGESVTVGGHSMKIGTGGTRLARREIGGLVQPRSAYILTFWARGTGSLNVGFRDGGATITCNIDTACPVASTEGCPCSTSTGLTCMVPNNGVATSCTISAASGVPGVSPGTCKGGANNGLACTTGSNCPDGTCSFTTATSAPPRSSNFADDDEASVPPRTTAPKITLSSEWKQYTLGPVIIESGRCSNDATRACATNLECGGGAACNPTPGQTPWGQTSVKLNFEAVGTSDVFVDNVDLKAVQDSVYVVRDSWTTPASCDQTADGIASPQEMLGCREYTTSKNEKAYLRSFTNLCRDKAVGCRAFSAQQNTPQNPFEESFNAVCRLYETDGVTPRKCGSVACNYTGPGDHCTVGGGCSCTKPEGSCLIPNNGTTCDIPVAADAGTACVCNYDVRHPAAMSTAPQMLADVCRVAVGETDCRFKYDAWDDSTRPDENPDRANIEADRRVYLVDNSAGQCTADQVGCRAMGLPHYGFEGQCDLGPGFTVSGTVVNGVCNSATGCVCGPVNGGTCPVANGEKGCKVSFELGVIDKWNAIAIKDDPSKYEQTLCTSKTLNCEEYTASDGTYYFRDPVDKVCEYKDNAIVNGQTVSGFFRRSSTGALFPCYPELLQSGDYYALYKNADRVCTLPNITTTCSGSFCSNPAGCGCTSNGSTCVIPNGSSSCKIIDAGRCKADGCQCFVAPDPVPACKVYKDNTTCGYQGWVGVCEAKYDRCEEFVDPVSTSNAHPAGEPYYYIVNTKLDLKTCSGKASLKQGCVLFKQTSKTQNLYSAASSYLRSVTEASSGFVPPVNCDSDPRSPYCEQRCFSIPEGVCSATPEKFCKQDTEDPELGCPGATNYCTGRKRYGNGCSTSDTANPNKDCNKAIGEQCAGVSHCSITTSKFCDVNGDCPGGETCTPNPATQNIHILKSEAGITKNDANVIIKVRPDRECAQWYTCTSYDTVYDEQQNKIKPVCSAFSLCDEIRGQTASAFECAHTFDPPKTVLTDRDYTARDVTFSGLEYSGYSIPGRYPAQYLSPFSIVKGRCVNTGGTATARGECVDSLKCTTGGGAPTDYCKMYTGVCLGDRLGTSCDANSDCGVGYCAKSFFATTRYAILLDPGYVCKDDTDCTGDESPSTPPGGGGTCTVGNDDNCRTATNRIAKCIATNQCSKTGQAANGTCLEHKCFYPYGGGILNPADAINQAQCRAYPEEDSPYAESVLERTGNCRGFDCTNGQALNKKAQFSGSNVCSLNNDCECNYQRYDYGKTGVSHFYGLESGQMIKPWTTNTDIDPNVGVCQGGSLDGKPCRAIGHPENKPNKDCTNPDDATDAGTCQKLTKLTHVNGWSGFCMDPDKSILVNGRPDQFNCNVWLPVDQLAGSPDNFNQFVEAGFTTDQQSLLYCAAAEGAKHSGTYEFPLHLESGGKSQPYSICVTDNQCAGRSLATCTGLKNNSSAGFSDMSTSNTDACAVVGGKCVDKVATDDGVAFTNADNPPAQPNATMTGDGSWNTDFNNKTQVPANYGACDRAAFKAADDNCTAAIILGGIFGGFAGAAAGAGLCYSGIAGWCDGLATCHSRALPGGNDCTLAGSYFDTSWQDATVMEDCTMRGQGIKENDLVAVRIQFPDESNGGVNGRLYLYPGHWKSTFEFDDNSSLGTAAGPGRNQRVGDMAIGDYGDSTSPCAHILSGGVDNEDECESIEDRGGDDGMHNCIGVEAVFDSNHNLDKIRTVLCHNESTFSHHISASSYAMLREACTDVVQTHNASNPVQNIAWTDRLWKAQNGNAGAVGLPAAFEYNHHTTRPNANPADLKPFGPVTPSLGAVNYNGQTTLDVRWPLPVFKSEGGSPFTVLRREGLQLWTFCGYPTATGVNSPYDPPMGEGSDCWSHVAADPHLPDVAHPQDPDSGTYNANAQRTAAGYPYACLGQCDMAGMSGKTRDDGYTLLSRMFVKSFVHFNYDPTSPTGLSLTAPVYHLDGAGYDKRLLYMNVGNAPKILTVATGNCSQAADGLCQEGAEGITVDLPNCGGCTDYQGRVTASIKYYAFADREHMPIRRRIVDFGDGTSILETPGFYKNHRGCPATGTDNAPAGCGPEDQQCNTIPGGETAVPFGLTPQSCESRYFSDRHTYTCNPQKLATLPACTDPGHPYPCRDGDDCVFKPRVQVLDNWGMCNGSCPGGASGESGDFCFNSLGITSASDPINLTPAASTPSLTCAGSTCTVNGFTGNRNECWNLKDTHYDIRQGPSKLQPWTEGAAVKVRS